MSNGIGATFESEAGLPTRICMVGGSGRSGTTILKRVFSRHPEIVSVPELRFPVDPDGLVDFFRANHDAWSPYQWSVSLSRLDKLLSDAGSSSILLKAIAVASSRLGLHSLVPASVVPRYAAISVARFAPNYESLTRELIKGLQGMQYRGQWHGTAFLHANIVNSGSLELRSELAGILGSYWRAILADICRAQEKPIYLDDNTWSILWFDKVVQLLPEARLVHIYRDPRDVVASYSRMRWAPTDAATAAHWYCNIMQRWREVRSMVDASSILEISLEKIVESPREQLQGICDFWRVDWHDALLETRLDKANTGRWRSDFSRAEQSTIEQILEEEVGMLGYD